MNKITITIITIAIIVPNLPDSNNIFTPKVSLNDKSRHVCSISTVLSARASRLAASAIGGSM